MQFINSNRQSIVRRRVLTTAVIATIAQVGASAFAGTTAGEVTVSTSGSTALKNWFTGGTFTDINPNTTINIGGQTYPIADAGNGNNSLAEWNTASLYQLAPKIYSSTLNQNQSGSSPVADSAAAVRLEYHESGSVEGILEMANDQIAPITYITQNVSRDPLSTSISGTTVYGGNAVWVNYNNFGGKGGVAWTPSAGGSSGGYTLGNFYNQGTGTGTPANPPVTFTLGGTAQAQFNTAGGNLYGGQNAVQMALSDAVPVQVFANDNTSAASSTPWTLTPNQPGFGQGNIKLPAATLGTANLRATYQSATALNMPATAINPRTGSAFGTGAWNTAELGNLTTQTIATTATLFVANPGTGLTQVDRTDAQWLETTSRLQNGATFQMTTRDVNSGTRNVSSLETGIDPTWSVGVNDNGNGNASDGGTNQVTIGPGLRFSNKTAGGNELRPTVQSARMAVGTLSINDAATYTNSGTSSTNPIRALAYSNSTNGTTPYVQANYFTIAGVNTSTGTYAGTSFNTASQVTSNPGGQQYTIFQNEQAVTLKAPDATYNNSGSAYGTNSPNIQGDDSYGDVKSLLNNTFSSVTAAYQTSSSTITASPVAGLMTQGYIPPQLMAVQKAQNGLGNVSASAITANPGYNNTNFLSGSGLTAFGALVGKLQMGDPNLVKSGSASSVYGGNGLFGTSGVTAVNGFSGVGFNGQIPITSTDNDSNLASSNSYAGNWLFGNFNQNGVRDYDAVVIEAQKAQAALETGSSPAGDNAYTATGQLANSTPVTTGIVALDNMNGTGVPATKGDLIAMGDYDGNGAFDGRDLYFLAVGASLTSSGSYRPTEVSGVFTTGTIAGTGATFSTSIATSVLNKNVALDYLQTHATAQQKLEARVVLTGSNVPAGATNLNSTDPESGLVRFTYDSTGTNAYNKSDLNQDGVVDFNDALAVDSFNSLSFNNMSSALTAYEPTPVTGVPELANLVLATQLDVNSDLSAHSAINAADLAVVNTALTGTGTTNWYGYGSTKTGPGIIVWNRSGGTVNLYTGSSLQISAGTIHVITSGMDPFTDNNQNAPATATDTSKSLAMTVTIGGTLEYTSGGTGIQIDRLSSLNISGGTATLDAASVHANRSLLIVGSLNVSSGKLDIGNNEMIVQGGNLAVLTGRVKTGYANGTWTGSGITSSSAASDTNHLTAVGVMLNTVNGTTPLYGTASGSLGLFDGVSPAATDVLVKYTYYGDANLDGQVDGSDYSRIDAAFKSPALTGWANGDFNYDGAVNGSDYTLIDNAFNAQGAHLSASVAAPSAVATDLVAGGGSAVPEPTSLGMVAIASIGLLSRRHRIR